MPIDLKAYAPKVEILRATEEPASLCRMAINNTQQCATQLLPSPALKMQQNFIERVALMGHTSVFEHASITLLVENVSRGCMDQVTRHRMGSFTCSSTHYEPHTDTVYLVDPRQVDSQAVKDIMQSGHRAYTMERERIGAEARQMLPLATSSRFIWTCNARALVNFLRLRLCKRNMDEMRMLAERVYYQATNWFPELFTVPVAFPECVRHGCDQGYMSCNIPYLEDEI